MVDIATAIGVSHSTVQRTLSAAGVKTRPYGLRRATVRIPTDAAKLGYLAGLLDGEGSIQIRSKHSGRSVACKIAIYSTTRGVMDWLLAEIGGVVLWDEARMKRRGWKPIGAWCLYRARDVSAVLEAIAPLLIVKADLSVRAMKLFRDSFGIHDSPPTTTHEILSGPSHSPKSTGPSAGS